MFYSLKEVLEKRLREYSFGKEILGLRTCQLWQREIEKILGKEIGKMTKPIRFKRGNLTVKVKDSVLSQELRLWEEEIKKRVNENLARELLKRVIYKVEKF